MGLIGTNKICCQSQPLMLKEFDVLKLLQVHRVVDLILSSNGSMSLTIFTKTTNYKDNTDTKVSSGGTGIIKIPSHRFSGGAATHPSHLSSNHM